MANRVIFLSHIHEELELAKVIKTDIESEFSGLIDVFVSSDGISIPAGSNFLRLIENSLIDCVGAIYLISPISVKRNWINFELGAIWIRNAINVRSGKPEIPALPFCHSGLVPLTLPAPLNNLNAITANQSAELELAFRSLQTAVGGRGDFRTDFHALAGKIAAIELVYTRGNHLRDMLTAVGGDRNELVRFAELKINQPSIDLCLGFKSTDVIDTLRAYEVNQLKGSITLIITKPGTQFTDTGAMNGAEIVVKLSPKLIVDFKRVILGNTSG